MSEEVTKIIDALCEKLGVAANILVPEMAKFYIARLITSIVIDSVMLTISVAILVMIAKRKQPEDSSCDGFEFLIAKIFAGVVPVIALIVMSVCLHDDITHLAGWLASPTAAAIQVITEMIK